MRRLKTFSIWFLFVCAAFALICLLGISVGSPQAAVVPWIPFVFGAAQATVRDSIRNVRTLKYAHTAAVQAGDVIVANGQVLVAVNDANANEDNAYIYRGKIEVPKTAGVTINPGDVVYWDPTAGEANLTNTNTKMGICLEAAAAADSTVIVMLEENK